MKAIHASLDPGRSGGYAWRDVSGAVESGPMPEDWNDLARTIKRIMGVGLRASLPVVFHIERVGGYVRPPGTGRKCLRCGGPINEQGQHQEAGQPGSSMFNFGKNTGYLFGMLAMTSAEVKEIDPRSWQKPFLPMGKGKKSTTQWKNELKAAAQRRFPELKVTLKTADALLILAFSELSDSGSINRPEKKETQSSGILANGEAHKIFIANWAGKECVFMRANGSGISKLRLADENDKRNIPRGLINS